MKPNFLKIKYTANFFHALFLKFPVKFSVKIKTKQKLER